MDRTFVLLAALLTCSTPVAADGFGVAPLQNCNLASQSACPACPKDHPNRRITESTAGTISVDCGTQWSCDDVRCRHITHYCELQQKPNYICLTDKELKDASP